jgi:peptide/nickel transport system substrate-binding protein
VNLLRAALIVVVCMLAGCARAAPADRPLRLAVLVDPPGLNPVVVDNSETDQLAPLVHGYLLDADERGRLIPAMATAVPTRANGGISGDGRTVTYHLRRGVRWHDGVPFDARDVLFSFAIVRDPQTPVADRTGFDHIAAVTALDPFTVRVRLTQPFSPFVPSCFTMAANDPYPILPAHLLAGKPLGVDDPYNAAPVGLGPYEVVSWQRGAKIELAADPHFWRGAPAIARIDVAVVPNTSTLANLWKTGNLDVVGVNVEAGRALLDALRGVPGTHVLMALHNEFVFLVLNQGRPPLDDPRVRRAVELAVDRDRIQRALSGDLAVPGDTDRAPGTFAYDPAIVQPGYDPARAAAVLDADGWHLVHGVRMKDGRVLKLDLVSITEEPTSTRFDLFMQSDLQRVGIVADEKSYAYNLLWASAAQHGINQTGRFDVEFSGWQPNGVNDHSYLFRCDMRPPAGDNLGRICDPAIDAAARVELAATNASVEAAADRAISARLVDRTDLIFLGFERDAVAVRDGITGVKPSLFGEHFWNVYAWKHTP